MGLPVCSRCWINCVEGYELGEAILDGASTAIGMYSTGAGVFGMFMGATKTVTQEEENALIEKAKADPNSYYNQHAKPNPSSYEFTLPPFSIDEFSLDE